MDIRMFRPNLWTHHSVRYMCRCPYPTISLVKSLNHHSASLWFVDSVRRWFHHSDSSIRNSDMVDRSLDTAAPHSHQSYSTMSYSRIRCVLSLDHCRALPAHWPRPLDKRLWLIGQFYHPNGQCTWIYVPTSTYDPIPNAIQLLHEHSNHCQLHSTQHHSEFWKKKTKKNIRIVLP